MGKYADMTKLVYSIFGTTGWLAENIKTIPSDFTAENLGDTYIRVSIISDGTEITKRSSRGIINIDIFTPAGEGSAVANSIADRLDAYLSFQTKSLPSGSLQMMESSMNSLGVCKDNSSLTRSLYSVPFYYYGV